MELDIIIPAVIALAAVVVSIVIFVRREPRPIWVAEKNSLYQDQDNRVWYEVKLVNHGRGMATDVTLYGTSNGRLEQVLHRREVRQHGSLRTEVIVPPSTLMYLNDPLRTPLLEYKITWRQAPNEAKTKSKTIRPKAR